MTETSSTSSLWSPELSSHLAARLPGTPVRDVSVVKQQPRSATRSAAPSDKSEGKPTALAEIMDHMKDLELLMEYRMLAESRIPGVYLIPSQKSLREWHGVLFVQYGPYKGGVFRFVLYILDGYPKLRPMVRFDTEVYHPYIHQHNRTLNMSRVFPEWDPSVHHIQDLIRAVRSCFLDEENWNEVNTPEFQARVHQCVEASSTTSLYAPDSGGLDSLIQFSKLSSDKLDKARKLVQTGALPRDDSTSPSLFGFFSKLMDKVIG